MFDIVKKNINLVDVLEKDLNVSFKTMGEKNWVIEDEKDYGGCPFCHHFDCFRVHSDGDNEGAFLHCFSCNKHLDVIGWRSEHRGITPKEAALGLGKEYNLNLPNDYNPIQEIFSLAASYYQNCFWDTCNKAYSELGGKTPAAYQTEVRKHSEGVLKHAKVGWSDGGLVDYLESLGIDPEVLIDSGLKNRKTGKDYLPYKCFIYPHFVKGRVSHFTFKDPTKRLAYQLPSKFSLNGHVFYGQDTAAASEVIILVEGENDWLSVIDSGEPSVLASIGQLSGAQLDWLRTTYPTKRILTIFDPDDAGDLYRIKVEKIKALFKSVAHIRPIGGDVDELLSKGQKLSDIVAAGKVKVEIPKEASKATPELKTSTLDIPWEESKPQVVIATAPTLAVAETSAAGSIESFQKALEKLGSAPAKKAGDDDSEEAEDLETEIHAEDSDIFQWGRCYWKTRYKDGEPYRVKMSDFTMKLLNVFITEEGDRHREVVITKENGFKSKPFIIDSSTKGSLRMLRTELAKAADADWYGKEEDLSGMWKIVYSKNTESLIQLPRVAGRYEDGKGWIFRNVFISDSGKVIYPDSDGIFWLEPSLGIRSESLTSGNGGDRSDIPWLETNLEKEEADKLLSGVITQMGLNMGDIGKSLIMIGWLWANVYSDVIFNMNKGFPQLLLWGMGGRGKTTIGTWMQHFFDIHEHGSTTITQLKSGVGWSRKGEYYSSLPLRLDELKADDESQAYMSSFRTWYDRASRTMGVKNTFGTRTQSIRANLMLSGEDKPTDPATRERMVILRMLKEDFRELEKSYLWFDSNKASFSGITFHWLVDRAKVDIEEMKAGIRALDSMLSKSGSTQRMAKNWGAIGYFAGMLAEKYAPQFNFKEYLIKCCETESRSHHEDTTLMQFFEVVEILKSRENSPITSEHVMHEGDKIYIWFAAIYKIVADDLRGKLGFSKNAVQSALREEDYFVEENKRIAMGLSNTRQYVVVLDAKKCPDAVRNIAGINN